MASSSSPKPGSIPPNDDAYVSSEDEDFDPTTGDAERNGESSSESEANEESLNVKVSKGQNPKRGRTDGEAEDLGFENSGDEATIQKGKKRKRKDGGKADEDSGGEGGFVKTRRMRAVEQEEKKPLASADGATIDVDALWRSMNSNEAPSSKQATPNIASGSAGATQTIKDMPTNRDASTDTAPTQPTTSPPSEDMITIKRTYVFAGETITEEKAVPKSSAEARLYLQNQQKSPSAPLNHPPLRRPLKRKSRFEPNPEGIVKGLPANANRGPKLNVVEKSKLDWAGYVDKEGMQDELKNAEKAKDGYLSRTDFLGRVEAKREDELRNARSK